MRGRRERGDGIGVTTLMVVLLNLTALAVAALVWLHTGSGRAWLTATAIRMAAADGIGLELEGLEMRLPYEFGLARLRLADRQGVWLDAEAVRLRLAPWALLSGTIRVLELAADHLDILRSPVAPDALAATGGGDPLLPVLPVALRFERVAVGRLMLSAALTGAEAPIEASLEASGVLDPLGRRLTSHWSMKSLTGGAGVSLDLAGTPEPDGRLRLTAEGSGVPAPLMPPSWRASVGGPVSLALDAIVSPEGERIEVRRAGISGVAIRAEAQGVWTWAVGPAGAVGERRGTVQVEAGPLPLPGRGTVWRCLKAEAAATGDADGGLAFGARMEVAGPLADDPALAKVLGSLLGEELTLRVEGRLAPDTKTLALAVVEAKAAGGKASADGVIDLAAGRVTVDGRAELALASVARAAGLDGVAGRLVGNLGFAGAFDPGEFDPGALDPGARDQGTLTARLEASGISGLPDGVAAVIGSEARAEATAELGAAGRLTLKHLAVSGGALSAEARGRIDPETVDLAGVVRLAARDRVAHLVGQASAGLLADGRGEAGWRLEGRPDAPVLTVEDLTLAAGGIRVEGRGRVPVPASGAAPEGIDGTFSVKVAELGPLAQALAPDLGTVGGALEANVTLGRDGGDRAADSQKVTLIGELRKPELRSGDGPADTFAAERLGLTVTVTAPSLPALVRGRIDGRLTVNGVRGGGWSLPAATATLAGSPGAAEVSLTGRVAPADTGALIQPEPAGATLTGQPAPAGASLRRGAGAFASSATIRQGTLSPDTPNQRPRPLTKGVPWKPYNNTGTTGKAGASSSERHPAGGLPSAGTGGQRGRSAMAAVGALAVQGQGHWRADTLALEFEASGTAARVDVTASLPLSAADGWLVRPAATAPVRGRLHAVLEAALANDWLAAGGQRVGGRVTVDGTLGGTPAAPQLAGSLTVANGRFEDPELGTVIETINGRLEARGDTVTVVALSGKTPNGGTLQVAGSIAVAARTVALRIDLAGARVIASELADAEIDAALTLDGPLTAPRLAGTATLRRAELRIPDRPPVHLPTLAVTEVGSVILPFPGGVRVSLPRRPPLRAAAPTVGWGAGPGAGRAAGSGSGQTGQVRRDDGGGLALAVTVVAPGRVFVRGRGLDLEFSGRLIVAGSASAPRIEGQLMISRGDLSLFGHSFRFERGTIAFAGGAIDNPDLDLLAKATGRSVTATVAITGTVRDPRLALSSVPELPADEVLAQLLFGKASTSLSGFEAAQLADSAVQLAGLGGSAGLIERLRRTLGIDRLSYGADASGTGGSVSAGRYLGEGVFVGVEQGVGGSDPKSEAKIELELTDTLKLEGGVDLHGQPRVGVSAEWEY